MVAPTTSPTMNLTEISASVSSNINAYHAPLPKPFNSEATKINNDTCFQFVFLSTPDSLRSTPNQLNVNQVTIKAIVDIVVATAVR